MANMRSEDEVNWNQEDTEVFGVQQENQLNDKHVPIRRKQLKHIESREDRINIYSKQSRLRNVGRKKKKKQTN